MTAPLLPRVTLRCEEAGMYSLHSPGVRWVGPVLLLAGHVGWRYTVGGVGHPLSHPTFAAARLWLASDAGRAWVAALPTAGDPT